VARAITIDGDFQDWVGIEPALVDVRQQGGLESVDFGSLWLSNDLEALFLRFSSGNEIIWQNDSHQPSGNDIRLYLDTDADTRTGTFIGGMGADYEIRLGSKIAYLHHTRDSLPLSLNQAGITVGPTHSSSEFELRIPFQTQPDSEQTRKVLGKSRIRLILWESIGNDRLPDRGTIAFDLAEETVPAVDPIPFERSSSEDLRILSHNIHYNKPLGDPGPFRRYLEALQPDIVNLQEVWLWDAEETKSFVTGILDPASQVDWYVAKVEDCVTVSRWPLVDSASVDDNLVSLIDLPFSRDLVLFNAHTPCCGHNDRRDYEHDHLAATWRDLLNKKGPFTETQNVSVIFLGDFNMVGYARQLHSLRDGDIFNNQLFGTDFQPDRKLGSLKIAPLRHTHSRRVYTWRNDSERFPPWKIGFHLLRIKSSSTQEQLRSLYSGHTSSDSGGVRSSRN
jgi:hypothetical protein